jgi:hypothetical protein
MKPVDSEEFEQIPWSGLVAQAQPSVDPRWYAVGGVVGAVVIVLLVMRMFSGSAPPDIAPVLANESPPDLSVPVPAPVVEPPTVVTEGAITEADLMAIDEPGVVQGDVDVQRLVAEWFVTDYFTRDGSAETIASLEAALADVDAVAGLPHHEDDGAETFVEWARAFAYEYAGEDLVDVSVAFRTVHRGEDGFVRDPVRAVVVGISGWNSTPVVASVPVFTDLP